MGGSGECGNAKERDMVDKRGGRLVGFSYIYLSREDLRVEVGGGAASCCLLVHPTDSGTVRYRICIIMIDVEICEEIHMKFK